MFNVGAKLTGEMKALSIGRVLTCVMLSLFCFAKQTIAAGPSREIQAGDRQDADKQISDYKRQLVDRPNWTEGWYNLGALEYSVGRYDDAVQTLRKVVGAAPGVGDGWAILGLSEFELHHYSDARRDLERANALPVNDEETARVSNYHLALLWIRSAEFDRASKLLLAKFGRDSHSAQITLALGMALLQIPSLPDEIDPTQESSIVAAGMLAANGHITSEAFAQFLQAHPNAPNAHYVYALCLEGDGRKADALKELRQEAIRTPNSRELWSAISRVEQELGNSRASEQAAAKANALPKLDRDSDRAGENQSQDDARIWDQAMQDYQAGKYDSAIAELTRFLTRHSDNGTAWAVLGLSEFAKGDNESALLHLQRGAAFGLHGSPSSLQQARYTTGILLLHQGQFEQASEMLLAAARASSADEKIRLALGVCLLRVPAFPGKANVPKDLMERGGDIMLLLDQSKYDDAFPLFQALLEKYPSVPFLHYAYGTALMALSRFDEAAAQMNSELILSPNSSLPLLGLASINLRRHRPADAIPPAKHALKLVPDSPEAHYLLGRAYLDLGDDATALTELRSAVALEPDSPEIHFNLGRAYAKSGMSAEAAKERAEFLRLNELIEQQKGESADQMYRGPRQSLEVTGSKVSR